MNFARSSGTNRRATASVILLLFSCLAANQASAVERIYNIRTNQSSVTISGNIVSALPTVQLTAQGPGSLTTSYSGTIRTDRGATSIQFLSGSAIDANISGNWQPLADGASGAAPADYGGQAAFLAFTAVLAARDITADLTSDVLTLSGGGSFSLSTTSLNLTGGSVAYRAFTAVGTQSLVGLTSAGSGTGSLTIAPDSETLSIPINASFSFPITLGSFGSGTANLTFAGQLVADAVLLPGDYNENGTVDAADYVVWRNNFPSGATLPNDDTPGVDSDDYTRWHSRFGQTAASGSSIQLSAVPEPASAVVLLAAAIAGLAAGPSSRQNRPHARRVFLRSVC